MALKHHHLIYQASTGENCSKYSVEDFKDMLYELLKLLEMEVLIEPQIAQSKFNAWTGIMGIITSHVSFHYWVNSNIVQFDIYSCKEFNLNNALMYLDKFWKSSDKKVLFIDRDNSYNDFRIERVDKKTVHNKV